MAQFSSAKEFREVMDRTFALMSEDPRMGPALRDADTPQRFVFTDFDLVANIRAGGTDDGYSSRSPSPCTSATAR